MAGEHQKSAAGHELLIGTSGYSYPDWKGTFYPRDLKKRVKSAVAELTYLSHYFNFCEINATFYGHFEPKIAARWCDAVADSAGFQFGIKANKAFTHAPDARNTSTSIDTLKYSSQDLEQTRRFLDVLAEKDKLAVVLFQFPVSFKFKAKSKQTGELERIEGSWDYLIDVLNAFREYPKAVEFRHAAWDDEWVLDGLREAHTAWVNIDEPKLGDSLHGTTHVTAPLAYMRLHGRNYKKWFASKNRDERYDYLYSEKELAPIAKDIAEMADKVDKSPDKRAQKRVIAATNNHFRGQAPANGVQLKALLGQKKVKVPPTLAETYPQLKSDPNLTVADESDDTQASLAG
ncbi:MAG TPA: DUF72 domain-containing protein [Terriglobales bacterium]